MTALSLDITTDRPSRVTIAVSGEVDMATAPQLEDCLSSYATEDITVDLKDCGFLDSSGLGALTRAYKLTRAVGHTFRTVNEPDHILKVLEIVGLADMFHSEEPREP